ncbi:hypothetical protein GOARA_006_00460 [Gordonia araii NBRC 100433]|uniref:DUF4132 domain-containing protein n=1 Tax=Gordonia araii NBRC 100433 TaxID=1073574 RepID=G7GXG2_9ACTN|nr:DUF4132 domain-containing protein [Gordonia araii]NNG95927.1 DUF4132 domain-containing protein [Gordonia araii NBRC 100433]GAB08287.1 hypothetical protein GOARA_006_00460 [Gordonia araii NBRC 100433]
MGLFNRKRGGSFAQAAAAVIKQNVGHNGDRSLPDRVAEYIETGAGESSVLAEIAAAQPGYWTSQWMDDERRARQRLYAQLDQAPAEQGWRWARVTGATTRHFTPSLEPMAGGDRVECLVDDLTRSYHFAVVDAKRRESVPVHLATLEAIVEAGGGQRGDVVTAVFRPGRGATTYSTTRTLVRTLPDYPAAVADRGVALGLLALDAPGGLRADILDNLAAVADAALADFAPAVARYLVDGSSTILTAATATARRCPVGPLSAALREIAATAKRGRQLRALDALWQLDAADGDRDWAADIVAGIDSDPARDLTASWAATASIPDPTPPPPPSAPVVIDWSFPVTPEVTAALQTLQRGVNKATSYLKHPYFDDSALADIVRESRTPQPPRRFRGESRYIDSGDLVEAYAATPGVTAANLVTVLNRLGQLVTWRGEELHRLAATTLADLRDRTGEPTIAQTIAMLDGLGFDGAAVVSASGWEGCLSGWPDDEVAALVAAHVDKYVDVAENGGQDWWSDSSTTALTLLALAAPLPTGAADAVYRLAFAGPRDRRANARRALANDPRRHQRVVAALRSSAIDTRVIAAEWLAEFGTADDIEVLDARYHAERTDRGKDAVLTALAALGRSPNHYLNRETLSAQVAKSTAPGPAWLDWAAAPTVRWSGGGEPVDEATLRWLVASTVKAKNPEPSVSLRYYLGLLDAADAERFADWLLDAWCAQENSVADKGMLAICAAACRAHAAPVAEHYIRTYYGWRAAQCKALLAMLGWVDDPSAAQLLLSIATRFRTAGIQKTAGERVDELAERRGWSSAELADRTVPDAGFVGGELLLDFGPRRFHARIAPNGTVALFDDNGARLKSLPAPRISDDETAAAEAKKALSAARRTVKTAVKQATERLYEAMCAERAWSADDWNRYLRGHPIVGILAQRLVWIADDGTAFRPLDDGTLTDVHDDEVTLSAGATVQIASAAVLDGDTVARWATHFDDYDVEPLFGQFAPVYRPPNPQARSVDDFTGHLLGMFALRSAATKRGYERGETGDGGVVFDFQRTFPILGITVTIGFSGAQQPLDDVTVALKQVTFRDSRGSMRLGAVPSALLSAAVADAAAIAALGAYEPDWEDKVDYA